MPLQSGLRLPTPSAVAIARGASVTADVITDAVYPAQTLYGNAVLQERMQAIVGADPSRSTELLSAGPEEVMAWMMEGLEGVELGASSAEIALELLTVGPDVDADTLESCVASGMLVEAYPMGVEGERRDVAEVAVEIRDAREWVYEYARVMAEVGPADPDSEITDRMAQREADGLFDCDTFVVRCLEEAGYDLDISIRVGEVETTARRFVMIHAETILREEFQLDGDEEQDSLQKQAVLAELLSEEDGRMKGVVTALVASQQGTEIVDKNSLRPGDIMQFWYRKESVGDDTKRIGGHAVIIHTVKTDAGVLDESSPPSDTPLQVRGIGALSTHGARAGGSDVYTKAFVDPDAAYMKWSAVRPSGSRWPLEETP